MIMSLQALTRTRPVYIMLGLRNGRRRRFT